MLACHIHSTAELSLSQNSLTGTIPSEIVLLSKLSESSVVLLLVVMIVLSCVFHCTLMLACHIHSTAELSLSQNSLTGTIPSEIVLLSKLSESSVVLLLVVMIVLSCVFFIVLLCLLVIFHSSARLDLSINSLTGTIPSQIALMSNLCESSVVLLLVVMIVLSCVFFIVLSCLLVIFHSTDELSLRYNNLIGMIPSHRGLRTKLSKSSVVWLLVVMIVLLRVFFIVLSCLLVIFHSPEELSLRDNNLIGTIPSQLGLLTKLSKSSVVWLFVVMIVLSCVFHCTLMLAGHVSFYRWVVALRQ
jgi:hypothetical protein